MGRSRKIPLTVEADGHYIGRWETRHDGAPSARNLARWWKGYLDSFFPGGANAHVSSRGYPIPFAFAEKLAIVDQRGAVPMIRVEIELESEEVSEALELRREQSRNYNRSLGV